MSAIFANATRAKLRFSSIRGNLSVEDLWDLPLTSAKGASLDEVGRKLLAERKSFEEESLVSTKPNPAKAINADAIEIVKYIVGVKEAERDAAKVAKEKAALKAQLTDVLARKQAAAMEELPEAEIIAKINALGA